MATDSSASIRSAAAAGPTAPNPAAMIRSRPYAVMLVIAAVLGVPIAAAAYWFLKLTSLMQHWAFSSAPSALGFDSAPAWWPLVPLTTAGLLVGATIRFFPGGGGEPPTRGFHPAGVAQPITLPGIFIAAVLSIGLGAVIGPEGPLVALGGGLAYVLVRLVKSDMPARSAQLVGATGSFAAIATLLGNPLAGALLLM